MILSSAPSYAIATALTGVINLPLTIIMNNYNEDSEVTETEPKTGE